MKKLLLPLSLAVMIMLSGCQLKNNKTPETQKEKINTLSAAEVEEGWVLLFDGSTLEGWKNYLEDTISGWIVEDGCLVGLGLGGDIGGDIVSIANYENFSLAWDWKLGPHGNSGVMYHVVEDAKYKGPYETGPEYQLIEDDDYLDEHGAPYPLEEWQKTAADYAMYLPGDNKKVHLREWNSSRIYFSPEKAEYWLNGEKVLEFVPWSEDWQKRRDSGKWEQYPDYGYSRSGKICLQDHGSKIWFRNIKILEL